MPDNTTTGQAAIPAMLRTAAVIASTRWDPNPQGFGVCSALAAATTHDGRPDETDLWDAVVTHLGEELTVSWERKPGRTRADVAAMLQEAAASAEGVQR